MPEFFPIILPIVHHLQQDVTVSEANSKDAVEDVPSDEDALDGILDRLVKLEDERGGNGEELGVPRVVEGHCMVID
jgi:hypothetical protein